MVFALILVVAAVEWDLKSGPIKLLRKSIKNISRLVVKNHLRLKGTTKNFEWKKKILKVQIKHFCEYTMYIKFEGESVAAKC